MESSEIIAQLMEGRREWGGREKGREGKGGKGRGGGREGGKGMGGWRERGREGEDKACLLYISNFKQSCSILKKKKTICFLYKKLHCSHTWAAAWILLLLNFSGFPVKVRQFFFFFFADILTE